MKHKKIETLNFYNINQETNAYMIEVSLDDYSELFNGWDASPLRRKDLEPELMDYLEQASEEIRIKETIELCFYVPKEKRDLEKEFKSSTSIMNNFKVVLSVIHKQISRSYRRLIMYIFSSLVLLTLAYLLRNVSDVSLLVSISVEGFFIGGWFLLWEAFSLFFFDMHEIKLRERRFIRFVSSDIYFKDTKE